MTCRRGVLLLSLVLLACARRESTADEPVYKPATADHGVVHRAWRHGDGRELKAPPGHQLVAAEIDLPALGEDSFDLDDIDIFDADTGTNHGSDPHLQRLTPTGEFVDHDDPVVKDRGDYRGIFIWAVPEGVRRVNFGYWGEMLYVKPVAVQATGPRVPEPGLALVAFEPGGAAGPGYERYRALLRATDWFRVRKPDSYTLLDSSAPQDRRLCAADRFILLEPDGQPSSLALDERPLLEARRDFLVEFWCPAGTRPDTLNHYGTHAPLPPRGRLPVSPRAIEALAAAPGLPHALHRLDQGR